MFRVQHGGSRRRLLEARQDKGRARRGRFRPLIPLIQSESEEAVGNGAAERDCGMQGAVIPSLTRLDPLIAKARQLAFDVDACPGTRHLLC